MEFLRSWEGYRVFAPEPDDDPNVLILIDQDGAKFRFDAGEREWSDLDDLLSLAWGDMQAGKLERLP